MLLTADTSVVVPSLLEWHELHARAASAIRDVRRLPAHAMAESFSVLTRLPPPRSLHPTWAEQLLVRSFPGPLLGLDAEHYLNVIHRLAAANLGGGTIYDAIVGATAAAAGARLLTADRRALRAYALMGVDVELLA